MSSSSNKMYTTQSAVYIRDDKVFVAPTKLSKTIINNPVNFGFEYNKNPYAWNRRIDWHKNINPCNSSSYEYIEGSTMFPNSLSPNTPLSITKSSKFGFP